MTDSVPQGREVIGSTFHLLACIGSSEPVRLIDLARESGLPRSTVHRLLAQLTAVGAVVKDGVLYRLGPTLLGLGEMSAQQRLRTVARRPMAELAAASGAAVVLSGPVGEEPVLLDAIDARKPLGLSLSDFGSAVGAGTAMGAVHGLRRLGGTTGTGVLGPAVPDPVAARRPPALSVDHGGCDPDLSCVAAAISLPQGGRAVVTALVPGSMLPHALLGGVRATALRIRGLLVGPDAVPSANGTGSGQKVY